jgi:ABC-type multidrug transport system fused ATPase/permease subunit
VAAEEANDDAGGVNGVAEGMAADDARLRLELAQISFAEVLRHLEHEDGKANRLLTAMAFLGAAAAAVFAAHMQKVKDPIAVTILDQQVSIPVTAFILFTVLLVFGVASTLVALGPSFNLSDTSKKEIRKWPRDIEKLRSLVFAEFIAAHEVGAWTRYWDEHDAGDISAKMTGNLIYETHLIATKAVHKVRWIGYGAFFFRASLFPLPVFLVFAFLTTWWLAVTFALALVLALVLLTRWAWLDAPTEDYPSRRHERIDLRKKAIDE